MSINPIRILCVFGALNKGGSETMCMNLFRHMFYYMVNIYEL